MTDARAPGSMRIVVKVAGCDVAVPDVACGAAATVGELRREVRRHLPLGMMFELRHRHAAGAVLAKDAALLREVGFEGDDAVHVFANDDHASPFAEGGSPPARERAAAPAVQDDADSPPPLIAPELTPQRASPTPPPADVEPPAAAPAPEGPAPPPCTSPPAPAPSASTTPAAPARPDGADPPTAPAQRDAAVFTPGRGPTAAFPWAPQGPKRQYTSYEEQQRDEAERIAALQWPATKEELREKQRATLQQIKQGGGYSGHAANGHQPASPGAARGRSQPGLQEPEAGGGPAPARTERAKHYHLKALAANTSDSNTLEVYDISGKAVTEEHVLAYLGLEKGLAPGTCKGVKWQDDHCAYIMFHRTDATTVDRVMRAFVPTPDFKLRVWDPDHAPAKPARRTVRPQTNVSAFMKIVNTVDRGNARRERRAREGCGATASPSSARSSVSPSTLSDGAEKAQPDGPSQLPNSPTAAT
eukprot:TRINITY_DN319_c0_g7_i1.p1 TRINITY_DN319_c0_g7~~TRINITY_DN319_c0_g7_i1.p1  ORF type:complete len:474 (+),score=147.66 TRINITY_DN319_c0_g7_i1:51-1472(+)